MKKKNVVLSAALVLMLSVFTGCASKQSEEKPMDPSSGVEATVKADSAKNAKDAKEITGTISDIKDFMFVLTDENGDPYAMDFENQPDGYDDLKEGDKVTVRYTGELSVVDAFTGDVLSVEKVN